MMHRSTSITTLVGLTLLVSSGAKGQSRATRSGAECAGVVAPADSTPGDSTWHPAQPDQIITPPMQDLPKSMRGRTISVHFLIAASGSPDSVDIKGFVDPEYFPRLRAALMKYHFRLAISQGCLVRAWGSPIAVGFHQTRPGHGQGRGTPEHLVSGPLAPDSGDSYHSLLSGKPGFGDDFREGTLECQADL